jgi:hypothetical protein
MSNTPETEVKKKQEIDGYKVIEEFLLTKGETIVSQDMRIPFKPLIDFGIIIYGMKANATNKLAMKFDLERFFMRKCAGELSGSETRYVKVPQDIFDRVKVVNDQYRNPQNQIEE